MTPFETLLQQGAEHAWLFIPSAILLGALHGLEPGHSKTMMAAFIVATRGTVFQAVLLGLSATVSHTAIVWLVAMAGLYFGSAWSSERLEPYLQLVSGAIIVGVAAWMFVYTWRVNRRHAQAHDHAARAAIDEHHHASAAAHHHMHGEGSHDAHQRAHAEGIRRRLPSSTVTTPQVIAFGLTGGLIPCPAAITVLLLCLQLKHIALGATLVLSFSIGLAVTLVAAGVVAALTIDQVSKHWSRLGEITRRAPYVSAALIAIVGAYVAVEGWAALPARP